MTSKKRILLLRSNEDKPDPYEAQLRSDDYEVLQVPVTVILSYNSLYC